MTKTTWTLLLVASTAFIASFFPIAKYLNGAVDPLLLAFFRFSIATIVLLPIMAYRHSLRLPPRDEWPFFILLGFLSVSPTVLVVTGIAYTNTIVSAILMNTQPLIIALLAPILIGEKVASHKAFSMAVGLVGVALIVMNGHSFSEHLGSTYLFGSCILLFAALLGGINKTLSRNVVRKYDGLYVTFFPVAIGSIFLGIMLLLQDGFTPVAHFAPTTYLSLIVIGIVCTAIPWVIWTSSLKHLDVHVAVTFNLLIPIFAALYSFLLFNETFTIWIALGMLLTSTSIFFVQRRVAVAPSV